MPEEAQAPVDYRALCEAEGWPPIRGGSPELDDAPADEAPNAAPQDEGLPAEPEPKGEAEPGSDYQKRYEDLHPQLTKAQQQNAELNRLFEAAKSGDPQALEILGLETQEDEDEWVDPDDQLRQEVEALKAERQSEKEAKELADLEAQEDKFIKGKIAELEKAKGVELSDRARALVESHARANRTDNYEPQVDEAFEAFTGEAKSTWERYLQSKKDAPRAPVGGPGEENIDLSDDDARLRAMAREFSAAEGSD